jgi:23S rRNA G2069 N7-methylase RlmK/C1962 C5-methylase RlmI
MNTSFLSLGVKVKSYRNVKIKFPCLSFYQRKSDELKE